MSVKITHIDNFKIKMCLFDVNIMLLAMNSCF